MSKQPQLFILTAAETATIRARLIPLARELGDSKYAYYMCDQAGYFEELMNLLSPARYELWDTEIEAHGEGPLPSVAKVFDDIEIEVFGEVVSR